jgi:hypothetical protein
VLSANGIPFLKLGTTKPAWRVVGERIVAPDIGALAVEVMSVSLHRGTRDGIWLRFQRTPTTVTRDGVIKHLAFIITLAMQIRRQYSRFLRGQPASRTRADQGAIRKKVDAHPATDP